MFNTVSRRRMTTLALWVLATGAASTMPAIAQNANRPAPEGRSVERPYIVEWVYKVKPGYEDEWTRIFNKYQIATLNAEKDAGIVTRYVVQRPALHTAMSNRWNLRVIIYYKNQSAQGSGAAIERKLFPDTATLQKEENRRWELTLDHWDLPIREVDPNQAQQ